MIKGIRHIIFDLGGVLLNLDYSLAEAAFIAAGIPDFSERYSQLKQTAVFDDFETGKTSRIDFIKQIATACDATTDEKMIINAWNAMLLDFPLARLQLLQQLRLHYDLFLLSNTNEIHEEAFTKKLMDNHGIAHIGMFFDKVYFSHRIGMRKPSVAIFEHVMHENQLHARHTLFIDDSPQHIEAAKALGIQTIFLEKGMTIEADIFRKK